VLIPAGVYRYEIRRGAEVIATEEDRFEYGEISGTRRSAVSSDLFEATARLGADGTIASVTARYSRGPFKRSASYEAVEEFIRGQVSAVGGRTVETAKLGRFREIDAGLVLFKAIIVAHVRERGSSRWTGRVAMIDPSTLVARSHKQTCRRKDEASDVFIYEPRMGDVDEIQTDAEGRIVAISSNNGNRVVLTEFALIEGSGQERV
jgi:hypothetical protein